ncbi:MAG: glycosyltransferase family 2 protein [Candidatus Delongbacteria bacterium]|nr:glycosyltransferase family 2 protein [Candidatus Delongbacteria bacterium]
MKNNPNPLVSVIITTYKRDVVLKRAINSVLEQSYKNYEIIVVDDNNPQSEYRQSTQVVMSSYANFKNIRYVKHTSNMNGAVARNTGIRSASGEIVCFLDDDDWYYKDKLKLQVNFLLSNTEYDAVYCGWDRDNTRVIPVKEGDLSFDLLTGKNLIYTNVIMMWKYAAEKIGGWDERFKRHQEAAFLLRYFRYGFKIGVVSEVLVGFDISDRSNALKPKQNKDQIDLYLLYYSDSIEQCENRIRNARKIIYTYRYRSIFLSYVKTNQFIDATKIYLKMMGFIPFRFNVGLLEYFFIKFKKNFS